MQNFQTFFSIFQKAPGDSLFKNSDDRLDNVRKVYIGDTSDKFRDDLKWKQLELTPNLLSKSELQKTNEDSVGKYSK